LTYRVEISEPAAVFLRSLCGRDQAAARELALILLSLRQNPTPEGSRELAPTLVKPRKGERIWERKPFVIVYSLERDEKVVQVGSLDAS
jgi:hypothetical protein